MTLRNTLLASLIGCVAGLAATLFLFLLDAVTRLRLGHPELIMALPLVGFAIAWIYQRFGRAVERGPALILDEFHQPQQTLPILMAPLILITTVLTHLCGGSAGREGTAVQMGAALADQLGRIVNTRPAERPRLLMLGAGAGFGAVVGAPWAGALFGMEVVNIGKLRPLALGEALIASFFAYGVTRLLHAPHTVYPAVAAPAPHAQTLLRLAFAGILFGLCARIFVWLIHRLEAFWLRLGLYAPLKTAIAGLLLALFFFWLGSRRYAGLGIEVIQGALQGSAFWYDPLLKMLLTVLTVGSGFKGGEFIPLVSIGSTLGAALGPSLSLKPELLAVAGFAAVFAGAANTPLSASLMAMEIFGWSFAPFVLLACFASYLVSGYNGIYKGQKILQKKSHYLRWR